MPLVGLKSRDWEIDSLLRYRTIEQLTSAKLTLQSLARLLKEISNIVITDVVGNRIKTALELVHESTEHLRRGDLERSFILSKEAFIISEAAFSDPTLLALLYFPEDQKWVILSYLRKKVNLFYYVIYFKMWKQRLSKKTVSFHNLEEKKEIIII